MLAMCFDRPGKKNSVAYEFAKVRSHEVLQHCLVFFHPLCQFFEAVDLAWYVHYGGAQMASLASSPCPTGIIFLSVPFGPSPRNGRGRLAGTVYICAGRSLPPGSHLWFYLSFPTSRVEGGRNWKLLTYQWDGVMWYVVF